ncbi:MAG: triose-phosphate isomerase [Mariniblastus sp.]|nr:triose-phosphate isomerase [Mariniblastus sp.]
MRRPIIAGNWKMNLDRSDSIELARGVVQGTHPAGVEIVMCPTFVYLDAVSGILEGSPVKLGGQDGYQEPNGAFTGAISMAMLADLGCEYVILGHSERRHCMGETNDLVNGKMKAALATGITPILCVGELLEERESGQTQAVVESQMDGSLADLSAEQVAQTVIAYEPVWAIGTGKTATPEQAQEVHADLRKLLAKRYNAQSSDTVRILYGGSVKPSNAAELLSQPDIDGALVGGASLQAESFLQIIAASTAEAAN